MASRTVIPPQARERGEVVLGMNKQEQKKEVVAGGGGEGRNRRALGDIGNLVTVGGIDAASKPQLQISRPMTRGFCAQLLAKAEAAAAADNSKKQTCVNVEKVAAHVNRVVDGAVAAKKRPVVPKPGPKKPIAKQQQTKPEEEIEISTDTVEEEAKAKNKKQEKSVGKKEGKGSSRKHVHTLTSVLSARSKAACGPASKAKDIVDIDAADANNDLAGIEYVEDIYKFYKEVETECRPYNYMSSQPEINEKMRAILVDWLIEVHHKFELSPETLYLTINIIDRFLCVKAVPRRELQLVGISAMLAASKYEEIWAPEVNDLVCISDRAYSHEQILAMEKTILGKLEWTLTVPTHYVFLARFIKASIPDKEMENTVYFLAELGLMNYSATMLFCPSVVAASAVYAARCTLNKSPPWTDTLMLHTGFSESQLRECAELLVYMHSRAAQSRLQSVHKKYSNPEQGAVAFHPPAKSLLPQ